MTCESVDRRSVLRGVAIAGAGVALTACSANGPGGSGAPVDPNSTPDVKSGATLGKADDIPVGGGKIFASEQVVVTQPVAGEFKGFSAICTHQGCIVSKVTSKEIQCPCHGSAFSLTDGSVVAGPAPRALAAVAVTNDAGTLTAG